jgi:hypothetical protein
LSTSTTTMFRRLAVSNCKIGANPACFSVGPRGPCRMPAPIPDTKTHGITLTGGRLYHRK